MDCKLTLSLVENVALPLGGLGGIKTPSWRVYRSKIGLTTQQHDQSLVFIPYRYLVSSLQ